MTPKIVERIALAYPDLFLPATGVAGVAGVAEVSGASTGVAEPARYGQKPLPIRQLRPLHPEIDMSGKAASQILALGAAEPCDAVVNATEERAALISETCPAPYVDTFARLNHKKPTGVSDAEWRGAINDAGMFLDAWGPEAAAMRWSAGEVFDLPRDGLVGGLIWRLSGARVQRLGAFSAILSDGRELMRREP